MNSILYMIIDFSVTRRIDRQHNNSIKIKRIQFFQYLTDLTGNRKNIYWNEASICGNYIKVHGDIYLLKEKFNIEFALTLFVMLEWIQMSLQNSQVFNYQIRDFYSKPNLSVFNVIIIVTIWKIDCLFYTLQKTRKNKISIVTDRIILKATLLSILLCYFEKSLQI